MATSPFSEVSYCKVLVPRPTHKRGRQGVAHDRTGNRDELVIDSSCVPLFGPPQLEWDHLIDAIRQDRLFNEAKRGAEASLVQIMGRMASHTGQVVTWDQALNRDHEFASGLDTLTMNSPTPVHVGKDGRYPLPQPGILNNREF